MKDCRECGVELIRGENWAGCMVQNGDYICRACQKAKQNIYFQANKKAIQICMVRYREENKEQIAAWKKTYGRAKKDRRQAILNRHKGIKGCVVCGEKRSECLDYHAPYGHTDRCIGHMVAGASWSEIKAEVSKCVIVCANCHRLIHAGTIKLE